MMLILSHLSHILLFPSLINLWKTRARKSSELSFHHPFHHPPRKLLMSFRFSHLRFYRSKRDCCRWHFEVVLASILVTAAGSRGTKMFAPNSGDPCDLYACIVPQRRRPISLRRTPAVWWMIAWRPLARERSAMRRTKCCCPDLERCPKRWTWPRWRAVWVWCEPVSFGARCVWRSRRNRLRSWKRRDPFCPATAIRRYHRRFRKNQCRRIGMNW